MITANPTPAAHAGEDQSSREFEARKANYENAASELLLAAKTLAFDHLTAARDDVRLCASAEHNKAIRDLFAAIKKADYSGLSGACAELAMLDRLESRTAPARDPRVPDMFEVQQ
jgi:hypothetical protein